jgi:hypothetical protein
MLGTFAIAGCRKQEEIRVYAVAKPPPMELKANDTDLDEIGAPGMSSMPSATVGPTRMLGAITPRGERTWFFKLMGAPETVEVAKGDFDAFVRSLKFSAQGPKWSLPAGWKAKPGNEIRFATILVPAGEKSLELSVTALPTGPGAFGPQLLANVNRWRDQVSLPGLSSDQLAQSGEVEHVEVDGEPVWVTDFTGSGKGSTGPATGAATNGSAEPQLKLAQNLPFDCEIPSNWEPGRPSSFQLAVFAIRNGAQSGTVSVSTAGGDVATNINRWREQVKLPDASEAEMAKDMQKLTIDGQDAIYIELAGPETSQPRKAILGVIVQARGKQWFIKLTADSELAKTRKQEFEEFVKSIKFK